ncbi:hypothetical protein FS749_005039 [Ceratobasidium sp. UAMH 11750]|nr:hypothetical protein FS749_005039 [Ceratobasidium sp. UAMH 11750]
MPPASPVKAAQLTPKRVVKREDDSFIQVLPSDPNETSLVRKMGAMNFNKSPADASVGDTKEAKGGWKTANSSKGKSKGNSLKELFTTRTNYFLVQRETEPIEIYAWVIATPSLGVVYSVDPWTAELTRPRQAVDEFQIGGNIYKPDIRHETLLCGNQPVDLLLDFQLVQDQYKCHIDADKLFAELIQPTLSEPHDLPGPSSHPSGLTSAFQSVESQQSQPATESTLSSQDVFSSTPGMWLSQPDVVPAEGPANNISHSEMWLRVPNGVYTRDGVKTYVEEFRRKYDKRGTEPKVVCSYCRKVQTALRPSSLTRHLCGTKCLNIKEYTCNRCGVNFVTKDQLTKHERTHTTGRAASVPL